MGKICKLDSREPMRPRHFLFNSELLPSSRAAIGSLELTLRILSLACYWGPQGSPFRTPGDSDYNPAKDWDIAVASLPCELGVLAVPNSTRLPYLVIVKRWRSLPARPCQRR